MTLSAFNKKYGLNFDFNRVEACLQELQLLHRAELIERANEYLPLDDKDIVDELSKEVMRDLSSVLVEKALGTSPK